MAESMIIRDEYVRIGEGIEDRLKRHGVEISQSALYLLKLAMQAQADDHNLPVDELSRRLERVPIEDIARYFRETYRSDTMKFNPAIHLIVDMGMFFKYPWTPTPPFRP